MATPLTTATTNGQPPAPPRSPAKRPQPPPLLPPTSSPTRCCRRGIVVKKSSCALAGQSRITLALPRRAPTNSQARHPAHRNQRAETPSCVQAATRTVKWEGRPGARRMRCGTRWALAGHSRITRATASTVICIAVHANPPHPPTAGPRPQHRPAAAAQHALRAHPGAPDPRSRHPRTHSRNRTARTPLTQPPTREHQHQHHRTHPTNPPPHTQKKKP